MPKISVVLSVYNGEQYLERAVRSILAQTQTDFECLIYNDGSDDRTADILASLAQEDERIRVISGSTSIGLTNALNLLLEQASGTFVARMDADDVAEPDRFHKQIAYLERHPSVGVVGSGATLINESGDVIGEKQVQSHPTQIRSHLLFNNPCIHSSLMIRTEALKQCGVYDPSFIASQDYELLLRIATQYDIANIPEPLVQYRVHENSISRSKKRQQWDALRARWRAMTQYRFNPIVGLLHIVLRVCWLLVPLRAQQQLRGRKTHRIAGDSLVVFFTYNKSLTEWKKLGMLERELALYKRIAQTRPVVFVTYSAADKAFIPSLKKYNICVLSKSHMVPSSVFSCIAPLVLYKHMRQAGIFKTNQMIGSWAGVIASLMFRKPLIVRTGYTYSRFAFLKKRPFRAFVGRSIERIAGGAADRIVVATEAERAWYPKTLQEKMVVIPNYVDTGLFTPAQGQQKEGVLFVGRLAQQKQLPMLLEAMRGIDAPLLIIGSGPLEQALKEQAGNQDVRFLGNVGHDALPEYMQHAMVGVLPSAFEGNPKVLLEMMACGIAVVGTNVEGIAGIIDHDINGLLVEPTAQSLHDAIVRLIAHPELQEQYGRAARKKIEHICSLDAVVAKEYQLYEALS